ncbi:2-hydroxy-3-oxopropionate reductase [Pseudoroseomonas deserti]|uniref:2-hydroxy-3-oxopropionate reductase n=1 Tax=Teichococcus deserti TaxID=1817963 RepID=A0A1V2H3G5_9PROT|nr:NAD(P)-dependent oxidoreductase [Pseudoroseomonas deserti]ONG54038.1 2-hydroxy-3-oxopropionate reductase [Pseudoroseomonas deserti]
MTRLRIGFAGIGLMGEAMTRRLLAQGHAVAVWNREPERLDTVLPHGATAAASPAVLAAQSDILATCVLHAPAVRAVVFGEQGLLAGARPGLLLVDLSTADPAATREMATEARRAKGLRWVDAPVSGGPPAALEGALTIMAGGAAADVEAALPLLRTLGANVTRMGETGAGQLTKLLNQAIVGAGYVLMAEALALAEAAGLEAAALPAALAGGHADSALLRRIYPRMQQRDFEPPSGYARQLLKDLDAVEGFAASQGLALPVVQAAAAQYRRHVAAGQGLRDSASVSELYARDG